MSSIHRALEHRFRAGVAFALFVTVALVVAACGSSGGSGGGDSAQSLLQQTFGGSHPITSGRLNLQLGLDVPGDAQLKGPIKLALSGPFQSQGSGKLPQFDVAAALTAQGTSFQLGLTLAGGNAYVKYGGSSYAIPQSLVADFQRNYEQGQRQGGKGLGAFGIKPIDWLSDPSVKGTEKVGGTDTTHITASLKVDAFLNDINTFLAKAKQQGLDNTAGGKLPSQLTAKERQQAAQAIKSSSVDVWTGKDDKTLRKLAVALNVTGKSNERGSVTFSIELADLNQPQTIAVPTGAKPLTDLLSQFQGLLGDTGTGSASSGSSSPGQVDRYTKCLMRANGDVAKAQKCLPLLNK